MTINERIKAFRKLNKLTQSDFSKELKIKQATLSQIENGKIQPSLNILKEINSKFRVSYSYLIDGNENNIKYNLNIDNNYNPIDKNIEITYIESAIKQLHLLYQRLIDIRMMLGKIQENNAESQLVDFVSEFSKTLHKYDNDLFITKTGNKLYKDKEAIDLNGFSEKEILSYKNILDNKINFFINTFFTLFKDFYSIYMYESN